MLNFIADIVDRFGGRLAGSTQERNAQLYFRELLSEFCIDVTVQEFEAKLTAKFGSLKFFCLVFYLNFLVFFFHPMAAAILGFINFLLFWGHFLTFRNWLDFLFPNLKSLNVFGTLEPQSEVKQTVILSGHMDSVREFKWWYRLKQFGAKLTLVGGALLFLQPLLFALLFLFSSRLGQWSMQVWWVLVLLAPSTIVFLDMRGKNVVDGAIDNLSGIAVALHTGRNLAHGQVIGKSLLQNTRIKIVSFGSEECGLRGSFAFAAKYAEQLQEENTIVLNFDTIRERAQLTILEAEVTTRVSYPRDLIDQMEQAFRNCSVPCKIIKLMVGGTDAAPFRRYSIPSISVIGMSTDKLDPTYHTRLDTLENLNPDGINALATVVQHFLKEWDKQ